MLVLENLVFTVTIREKLEFKQERIQHPISKRKRTFFQ